MIGFRKVFFPLVLVSSSALLSSCGGSNLGAPTPLATANFNGTWQFTSAATPTPPGITGMYGTLTSATGNQDSTSLAATGSLTLQGSCAEGAVPMSLTGTITNPHDIYLQLNLSGEGNESTLTINGSEVDSPNLITGTYSISGGACQILSTSFTAARVTQSTDTGSFRPGSTSP